MKVEEFKNLSDDELRQKANECLAVVDDKFQGALHTAHLLQAQLYMNEINRRNDEKIATRDGQMAERSHKMEKWVVVLILGEIVLSLCGIVIGWREGNQQVAVLEEMKKSTAATAVTLQTQGTIFDTINSNTAKTVEAVQKLQEAQDNSLKTSNASLRANKQIAETLTNQLKILKVEQDARLEQQSRRPVLELTTVTWEPGIGNRPVRLESGKMPGAAGVRAGRTSGTSEAILYFSLRNIGTSPAINVTVKPRTSSKVQVKCVESGVLLAATNWSYTPCQDQFGIIPPIYPRPSARAEVEANYVIPEFDDQYDAMVAVVVNVPLDVPSFDMELVVNAEQIIPLVYRLQCHIP